MCKEMGAEICLSSKLRRGARSLFWKGFCQGGSSEESFGLRLGRTACCRDSLWQR